MALQDLTPQLRTRLSRMEQAVGWFVLLAMALLAFGFVYYVYNTAERKGWFKIKAMYFTFTDRATGLKVGDPVQLMGFDVGRITHIDAQPPWDDYDVYVEFEIVEPYYGYLWTEGSLAQVNTADLLGKRVLEVTKGTGGYATYVSYPLRQVSLEEARALPDPKNWTLAQEVHGADRTNLIAKPRYSLSNLEAIAAAGCSNFVVMNTNQQQKFMTGIWNIHEHRYDPYTRGSKPYWLEADESAALTERLEKLVGQIETALPNILSLTNQLAAVLSNSVNLTANLNLVASGARPVVSNLAAATAHLDHPGALGEWLVPTNINHELEAALGHADATLGSAHTTLATANTNLAALMENLSRTLDNLAGITSNLNSQVAANTNLVKAVSDAIVHADEFVQGLKRHWLLRSAFKTQSPTGPPPPQEPILSPKEKGQR
jgi:ABC-type transporter Mla subunit MlaD